MSKVVTFASVGTVQKMCFGEMVARTLNGLRTNGSVGLPIDRIKETAKQSGLDPSRVLNRITSRRRARIEYRDGQRWVVINRS